MKDAGYEHAHSSPIKTPRQLAVVIVLAFALPVIGIILLTQLIVSEKKADPATLAPQAVAARIQPVARVEFAEAPAEPAPPTPAAVAGRSGEQIVQAVCGNCHLTGERGAPRIGDRAAWSKRVAGGLDAVVLSAIRGHGEMPARGGFADLTDPEMKKAVLYMFESGGAKPVPAAAAPVAAAPTPAAAPAATGGANAEQLLQKYACLACHAIDKKVIGPSYKEVAAKYAGDKGALGALAKKVKAGGQGVWGQVPMPPNPQVPDGDLQTMVKFILSQR